MRRPNDYLDWVCDRGLEYEDWVQDRWGNDDDIR